MKNCSLKLIFVMLIELVMVQQFHVSLPSASVVNRKGHLSDENIDTTVVYRHYYRNNNNNNKHYNCSYSYEEVQCDCDTSERTFKCYNIESSEDIIYALNYLVNVSRQFYWSILEVNCVEPFSTAPNIFHITSDLFSPGIPKFRNIRFLGDCSKPKHYDNLIAIDRDIESVYISGNSLRMTTSCSLLPPKLERLSELTITESFVAGDMISSTFSTRCLGQYGTRNEALPLTTLIITQCNITLIESGAFTNFAELQLIDLSNNQLSHLSRHVFASKMYKVRFLQLQYNRIRELSSDFFDGLPQLRVVNLVGNQLKFLPYIPSSGVPQVILLEGNLWDCRCKMIWIILDKSASESSSVIGNQRYYDEPLCSSPENVKDLPLMKGLRIVHETFC